MSTVFEIKPRWASAPPICTKANLPAFESKEALNKFLKENSPSCKVIRIGLCDFCKCYHAVVVPPDPSGLSSGTGRSARHHGESIEV